jgi:hypothetical protein
MTYWDRIFASFREIRRGTPLSVSEINQIEIYYDDGREGLQPSHLIQGGDECYDFLSQYSSFAEVQEAYELPGPVSQICCVNILDDFNLKHYGIEHPSVAYDRGTLEVFDSDDGPSMLEQEIARRNQEN